MSLDPADFTPDEMRELRQQADGFAAIALLPAACRWCGDDFTGDRLQERRAEKHPDVCLGCASEHHLELTPDESSELAEDYWTRRYGA